MNDEQRLRHASRNCRCALPSIELILRIHFTTFLKSSITACSGTQELIALISCKHAVRCMMRSERDTDPKTTSRDTDPKQQRQLHSYSCKGRGTRCASPCYDACARYHRLVFDTAVPCPEPWTAVVQVRSAFQPPCSPFSLPHISFRSQ